MNKNRLRRLLREALNEMDNSHYDRMPDSAMDRMIPAGNLEEILNTDGLAEFKDELAFHCEMLEQGDEPYHIMEPAEYEFIMASIGDFADDGDTSPCIAGKKVVDGIKKSAEWYECMIAES